MKKRIFSLFVIILTLIMIISPLTACAPKLGQSQVQVQKDFDKLLNDIFVEEVQTDTLSLNYSLSTPENYGITDVDTSLGEYSVSHMTQDLSLSENNLSRLLSFDYELLSSEQKLTYDILKNYLELDLVFGKFTYYNECLGPTTGIQAQLPILLAEYSFYDKADIEEYINLLPCVYDYFEGIVKYEQEKAARGLFMKDAVVDHIIAQCEAFIEDPRNNFLITYFDEKISGYKGLSKSEITCYKALNKEAVLIYVIPAYEMLIKALTDLKGSGSNPAGLYYFPDGKLYYDYLVKYKTGSNKSMEEIIRLLESAIDDGVVTISSLAALDSGLVEKYYSFTSFPITDPQKIIVDLKKDIQKDFPKAANVSLEIKYVPDSLSEYLSPAMYLIPPIDNYNDNNIYINGNDAKTLSMIYTTVAHESYPGHLYQCVYFRSHHPYPIRNLMNFVGYDEGWATYVEMYSYHISGIDESLADFLEANNIVILCMYARADIGIHYEGWTEDKVVDYFDQYIGDKDTSKRIYDTLLEEPAIYLPYAVGYLEIMELRNTAMQQLGDDFVAKDFHKFLLDIGPAPFGVIENYMEPWIKNRLN